MVIAIISQSLDFLVINYKKFLLLANKADTNIMILLGVLLIHRCTEERISNVAKVQIMSQRGGEIKACRIMNIIFFGQDPGRIKENVRDFIDKESLIVRVIKSLYKRFFRIVTVVSGKDNDGVF